MDTPYGNLKTFTEAEIAEFMNLCGVDFKAFCKAFYPDIFKREFSRPHDLLISLLADEKKKQVAICAPRGIGKTSLSRAWLARSILYRMTKYVVYVGASQDAAVEHTENLKLMLIDNPLIEYLYGQLETPNFSREVWDVNVVGQRIRVKPLGPTQRIRGRSMGSARPDRIILDDVENDENVESELQRDKLLDWVIGALINSVDRSLPYRVICIGTMQHNDGLVANLLNPDKFPSWHKARLSICNSDYKSLFPEYLPDSEVEQIVSEYRSANKLDRFAMEFMGVAINPEEQAFRPEYFQYYTEAENELSTKPGATTVVITDPARTATVGACNTCVTGLTVDHQSNTIFVRDIVSRRMGADEVINEMFDMAERIGATFLAPEVTGLNEFIVHPIKNEMRRRRKLYNLIELKPRDKKEKRAFALLPYYRQGLIKHNKASCRIFEDQLLMWPRPMRWDEIDTVAHIIPVCEQLERYFYPTDYQSAEEAYSRLDESCQRPLKYRGIA